MPNGNGGEWANKQYSIGAFRKMMPRPLTRTELVAKLGHTNTVERFFLKNQGNLLKLPEAPLLYYANGWWDSLPVNQRSLHDYVMSRRVLLQAYEARVTKKAPFTARNVGMVANVFRTLATHFNELADEMEARIAETDEEDTGGTDGSVHSSESD